MSRYRALMLPPALLSSVLFVAACAATPASKLSPEASAASEANATWYTVAFETNSYALDPYGKKVVDEVGLFLAKNPTAVATVVGRTDTVGSDDYNNLLSRHRADAVRDALVYKDKIAADRIETRWSGETRPSVTQTDNIAAAGNRVVDIAVH